MLQPIAPALRHRGGALLRALVIDPEGPLLDTGELHRASFNDALGRLGLSWRCDEAAWAELRGLRNDAERFVRFRALRRRRDASAIDGEIRALLRLKDDALAARVRGGDLAPRPGALRLLAAAKEAGLRLAIASSETPQTLALLLAKGLGAGACAHFEVVEHLGTAPRRRPDPQVCLQAVARLGLAPAECLAVEGSGDGLRAAAAAGLGAVIVPGRYQLADAFASSTRMLRGVEAVDVARLRDWHGRTVVQ